MRRLRPNRAAVWLCLQLQLVLGVPAGLGLSLCVDGDGCFAIEIAHDEISCLRLAHAATPGETALATRGEEQPCRDLQVLEGSDYEARFARRCAPPALIATLPPPAAAPDLPLFQAVSARQAHSRFDSVRRRSVVLIV